MLGIVSGNIVYQLLFSILMKYKHYGELYSDNFTVKLSEYNFIVAVFGGKNKFISLMNQIFSGNIYSKKGTR